MKSQEIQETESTLVIKGMALTLKKICFLNFFLFFLLVMTGTFFIHFRDFFWIGFPGSFELLFLMLANQMRKTSFEISKDSIQFLTFLNARSVVIDKKLLRTVEFYSSSESFGEFAQFIAKDGRNLGTISDISFDHWDKIKNWIIKHYPHRKVSKFWY